MSTPIVDSIRANGWRVSLHDDDTFTVAGEGTRFDADQVALMVALGGNLPLQVRRIVHLLATWRAHAPGVPGAQVMALARLDGTKRAQLAGQAAGKGPLIPLLVRDDDELVRQAVAVAMPAGTGSHPWFEILADDPAPLVRACVAINPHAPASVRTVLMDDPDSAVAVAARRNPSSDKTKRTPAQKRRDETGSFAFSGGIELRALEGVWAVLATSDDMRTRLNVAGRDDAPLATLDYLAREDFASLGTVSATRQRIKNRGW